MFRAAAEVLLHLGILVLVFASAWASWERFGAAAGVVVGLGMFALFAAALVVRSRSEP